MFEKQRYMKIGESYEEKTARLLESHIGGKCSPATIEENKIEHIDLHWFYNGHDVTIDVKGPKKYNRWDQSTSDVVWIEGQGITGEPGWVYGKSTYIAFWLSDCILFVYTRKLRNLYDNFLKNKQLHVGVKPTTHYELFRRKGRSDILFTMPVEDLRKIQSYEIKNME